MPVKVFAVGLNMHSRSTFFATEKWCSPSFGLCVCINVFSLYTDYIVDVVDIVDIRDNIRNKYIVDIVDIYIIQNYYSLKNNVYYSEGYIYTYTYIYIECQIDRKNARNNAR